MTFDKTLEFDIHINEKIKKASSICAMIRRSFKFLSVKAFIPLYKTLVMSHIEYGNSVWCPYKIKYIDAIEQVQRRAAKMQTSMDNFSYKERLKKLKLPTLVYRRLRGDMIEVYKILHGIYDMKVSPCLTLRSSETSRVLRGNNMYLVKERSRKN